NEVTPVADSRPLFHEATDEFKTMTTTRYQHRTRVDRAAGSYRYDCVGFVTYALKQAAPKAWDSVFKVTGINRSHNPKPWRYRAFFASLTKKPQPGWEAVTKTSELIPGDVVAWGYKTKDAVGHAVVIGSAPELGSDGSWLVEVYDSTSSPHGNDSRPNDHRAKMLPSTRRSG